MVIAAHERTQGVSEFFTNSSLNIAAVIGSAERQALREAALKSNATLKELAPDIQGVESYVAANKTFCCYLASDEEIIREAASRDGFPANKHRRGPSDDRSDDHD
jgi:hypothetical protein